MKICKYCKKEYYNRNVKYCGKNCYVNDKDKYTLIDKKNCEQCKKIFQPRKTKQRFCSVECVSETKRGNEEHRQHCIRGGKKGAEISRTRSKNEIYFYELCKDKYITVESNARIFNGFDADIVLMNEKIAVEWNGKWHYETVIKGRSLKQSQARDMIKVKEIKRKGFIPYIIKDLGRYDKKFVIKQFNEFKNFVNDLFMHTWKNYFN